MHHPIEASNQKKQPLLGASPERPLLKAPWSGTKRVYGAEEVTNANASPTYPPPIKRQALLPTPGEWGYTGSKLDNEQAQPVSGGLLPRPYRQITTSQTGLLPPPTSCSSPRNIYTPPPATTPCLSPLESIKTPLRSATITPTAALSPTSGLLPLPVARHNDSSRNMESRSISFKKAPLLQTPNEGVLFSNSKKPLLPLLPMSCMPQEKISKPPLLQAPPAASPSCLKLNSSSVPTNGSVTCPNNGQRQAREPLIPTPPPVLRSRFDSSSHSYKKTASAAYHQSSLSPNNSTSIKRPLLPTPTLLC